MRSNLSPNTGYAGQSRQYLVKWKGYPTVDNMWEPKSNLEHAAELLEEYKSQHLL
jgi:hypothetical protein